MSSDVLGRFAGERGLAHRETGAIQGPFSLLRRPGSQRVDGLVRGELLAGVEAVMAGVVFRRTGDDGRTEDSAFTVVTCKLLAPGGLPWLECRSLDARMLGGPSPAPRSPGLEPIALESEFFARRFELLAGNGTDPKAVVQLFSPSFLHWYAYESPFGLDLELLGGRLCLSVPSAPERLDHVRSLWDAAATIVAALAAEASEDDPPT